MHHTIMLYEMYNFLLYIQISMITSLYNMAVNLIVPVLKVYHLHYACTGVISFPKFTNFCNIKYQEYYMYKI